jgi:hypothetical protein
MYSYLTQWSNSRNLGIQIKSISPSGYSLNVGFEFSSFLQINIKEQLSGRGE